MGICTEQRFISSWISRIPGGIIFPCTVLCNIYVESEHENQGYGTEAMNKLDQFSIQNNAAMGIVRIGWTGDKMKNLYFYKKNGWEILTRNNEFELFIAYKKY
jgi:GNAT superfamily N-acetyltransferase